MGSRNFLRIDIFVCGKLLIVYKLYKSISQTIFELHFFVVYDVAILLYE
jgi:hypothetical protein